LGKVLSADKMTIQTLCKQDYGAKVMEFRHDGKLIECNAELWRFGYWKTETKPSDCFPQTPTFLLPSMQFSSS